MNEDVRRAIRISGFKHWQIAAAMGIGETTLCRWLRDALTAERRAAILSAIEALSREQG